jgi:hypothetical protein
MIIQAKNIPRQEYTTTLGILNRSNLAAGRDIEDFSQVIVILTQFPYFILCGRVIQE